MKEELPLEIKSQNIFPTHFSTESFLVPAPIKITKKKYSKSDANN